MFGTPSIQENLGYNFMSDDNASKWKGQFLHALQEVSRPLLILVSIFVY